MNDQKVVLILGANSDTAREAVRMYVGKGFHVIAASRNTAALDELAGRIGGAVTGGQAMDAREGTTGRVTVMYFDAEDFGSHASFYSGLPEKPHIVVYAAGWLRENVAAMHDWEGAYRMMRVHYCGAVSILNIIVTDEGNDRLERIIGLSSLSGVRGRKSNFIYGSTKSAFTQYLAGMRQYLFPRGIVVNVIVAGYIRSKMTRGLDLPESLMLEPGYIARAVVDAGKGFTIVPGFKWKVIWWILRILPERLVAKLP